MPRVRHATMPDRSTGYADIADYAMIGDRYGAALVCLDGSIDWCCMPRFDAEPLFARILDQRLGGHFTLAPQDPTTCARAYMPGCNVLETRSTCGGGKAVVTDFMVVSPRWSDLRALVRIARVESGSVAFDAHVHPGALAEAGALTKRAPHALVGGGFALCDDGILRPDGQGARGHFVLEAGETRAFALFAGEEAAFAALGQWANLDEMAQALCDDTCAYWRGWSGRIRYRGPYRAHVERSALTLKMMIYEPTGAMIAAPTTSLPEDIGGVRNWDYRFCWPRDAAFAFYALKKLGISADAERFFGFFTAICEARQPPVPPLFAIDGLSENPERQVETFEGYRGSAPVNLGNEASEQHQIDVYGQVIDLIHMHERLNGGLSDGLLDVVCRYADFVAAHWREPDAGIWEARLPENRHVHSAIMSWTALDRAIRMVGPRAHWLQARDEILEDVRSNGVHPRHGHLTQTFGGTATDAATLIAAVVGMPLGRDVLERTCDAVIKELGAGPLVYRYRNDDGLPGEEGAFLVCSFWLADALLTLGREREARERFDALLARANDVGLFPEQMGEDGVFLGNFPQAFTHLGVLQTALMLELFERGGVDAMSGGYAERALALGLSGEDA